MAKGLIPEKVVLSPSLSCLPLPIENPAPTISTATSKIFLDYICATVTSKILLKTWF